MFKTGGTVMIVAAIDTGGTKIVGAAVDDVGNILETIRIANTGRNGPFIMNTYRKIISILGETYPIAAIGIGAGGRIEEETGKVLYAVGIYRNYIGLEMKRELEEEFHLPVAVTNDCRAAVIGEKWVGAARDYSNIVGIILGTGVGGGYIYHNHILNGAAGGFGEIGHMILHPDGRQCSCGQKGCAEQYISGTALWNIYNEETGSNITSGYEFFQRVKDNDQYALAVLEQFKRDLAVCSVNCANVFDPDILLFGGGLMDTCEFWWDDFVQIYQSAGNEHTSSKRLVKAANKNAAALLGAAETALKLVL